MNLRTANKHRVKRALWAWWRPRFDSGDFSAFLMALDWKSKETRYFRTPKSPDFWSESGLGQAPHKPSAQIPTGEVG